MNDAVVNSNWIEPTLIFSEIELKNRQQGMIKTLRDNLQRADPKKRGMVTLEEFILGLRASSVECISKRDIKKIFTICTTNGSMKIDLFMDRFSDKDRMGTATDIGDVILNVFNGIVCRKKKKKKHKKKKKKKKVQIENGFSYLRSSFVAADQDNDNKINFDEFMSVIVDDLRIDLTNNECKQLYFHQRLSKCDHYLDLKYFLGQIHEEYLSFPSSTSNDLLRRYFIKILSEASAFERLNEFILELILSTNESLENEILSYESMSEYPLLQRVSKDQRMRLTDKYRTVLHSKVTPHILSKVIRSIRKDSVLKEADINNMYKEWRIGLQRNDITNLSELEFLLYHLGLSISLKLLKRLNRCTLYTVFEDEKMENVLCDGVIAGEGEDMVWEKVGDGFIATDAMNRMDDTDLKERCDIYV